MSLGAPPRRGKARLRMALNDPQRPASRPMHAQEIGLLLPTHRRAGLFCRARCTVACWNPPIRRGAVLASSSARNPVRIWLIEGLHETRFLLRHVLQVAKLRVEWFVSAAAALAARTRDIHLRPEVIMVAWHEERSTPERELRNLDVLGFIREFRASADPTPIMLYTSTDRPDAEVAHAFEAGAADFISAPHARPGELLGRLRALRGRTSGLVAIEELRCGSISVDLLHCRVKVEGHAVELGGLEYRLLVYLAERAGQVVPTGELLEAVFETPGSRARGPKRTRAPTMAISRLRHKLGPARDQLVTFAGFGFMLESNPVLGSGTSRVGRG